MKELILSLKTNSISASVISYNKKTTTKLFFVICFIVLVIACVCYLKK